MSTESQIVVPQSFIDVFVPPGRIKPTETKEHIAARYEFCEDLAIALIDRARHILWVTNATEPDVIQRIKQGLLQEGSGVEQREAEWVCKRLSELLATRVMG